MSPLRLDDLYKMVSNIYSEQNAQRPASATFAHFVEVCGMLTIHDRQKRREEVTPEDALCKALAWFFPLMAKFKVKSLEELIFRKYPYACPYCRLARHDDDRCKTVRGTKRTVDHEALRELYRVNSGRRPVTLDDWQTMFRGIYPRSVQDAAGRSTMGLMEELGELAEAVRVFDRFPKYFAGEAADVFSYLMGFANEHALRLRRDHDQTFSFEEEFVKRYPGMCVQCGYGVCVCPLVPDATVGRLAKELDVGAGEGFFSLDADLLHREATRVGNTVLEGLGGHLGVLERFPFDRGDTNKALVLFCLELADAIDKQHPDFAERLRSAAFKVGSASTYAGSRKQPAEIRGLVESLQRLIGELGKSVGPLMAPSDESLRGRVGRLLGRAGSRY